MSESIEKLVKDLIDPNLRENALLELSKRREAFPEMANYLWHSFGTIAALTQEVMAIYYLLNPPSLTAHASNRVCNALALLQCVASHPQTRQPFLDGTLLPHLLVARLGHHLPFCPAIGLHKQSS